MKWKGETQLVFIAVLKKIVEPILDNEHLKFKLLYVVYIVIYIYLTITLLETHLNQYETSAQQN